MTARRRLVLSAVGVALRPAARRAFYRIRIVRELVAAARWPKQRRDLPDLAHLTFFKETADGPVQRDEALFLHSLVRVVRPRTIVEIGFLRGHSAFNFLRALDGQARLYSFDIDPSCADRAHEALGHDSRFVFRTRSQASLTPEDIDGRRADFIFLDASHDLTLNQATFERLLPLMTRDALFAIHDTGTVPRQLLPHWHWWLATPDHWIGEEREVAPDERADRGHEKLPTGGHVIPHSSGLGLTVRCSCTVDRREDVHEERKDSGGAHRPV